jgi:dTDP-4-amino-4,6-dideoxygalactose transaminase
MYTHLGDLLYQAQEQVLTSGQVMLGKYTSQLEEKLAERANAQYCSVVGSGSDALMYGLRATGKTSTTIPAQTFIATKNSCRRADMDIVFADVRKNGCVEFDSITTDSVVWVGLFGNDCVLPEDITVYEDGAQHFGLPLKGEFASYSFDPTKSLPNFGNGGAVVSNNEELIYNVKQLRRHGQVDIHTGGHSVMSERDCAELLVKLKYFDNWTRARQELAGYYIEELEDYVDCITDPRGMVSKFVIATDRKSCLKTHLALKDIQCKDVYAAPLANLEQATANCERFLSIPCDSYTTYKEALTIVEHIKMFFKPSPLKT